MVRAAHARRASYCAQVRTRVRLQKYQEKLKCDTDDLATAFNDTRDSLHDSLTTPFHSFSGYSGFLWGEIVKRDYWWDRDKEEVRIVSCAQTCTQACWAADGNGTIDPVYIGSISGIADGMSIGEAVLLSTGTSIPVQ